MKTVWWAEADMRLQMMMMQELLSPERISKTQHTDGSNLLWICL